VRANRGLGPSYVTIAPLIWAVSLPMAAGIIAVAPEIVRLLLGPQWQAAQAVLRWLALGTGFTVMTANTHYVYWALGHSRIVAGLSFAGVALVVPATIVCSHLAGYTGVAFAFACASALMVPISFVVLRRLTGIRFLDLWARVWRIALGTTVMGVTIWLAFANWSFADAKTAFVVLLAKILVGATTYSLVVWAAWLSCGKPLGPEHAVFELLRQAGSRWKSRYLGGAGAR
jgi:lipopolysaccharide exporter